MRNEIPTENKVAVTPLTNRHTPTIATTLRIPKHWLRKLKQLARRQACRHKIGMTHCDLIREAVFATYIGPEANGLFKNNCDVCRERMQYRTALKMLNHIR